MPSGEASRRTRSGFWMLALLVEIPLARMLWLADLRHHTVETISLLLATSIFYLVSVWLLLRNEVLREKAPSILWILSAAFLFRVTVFPLYPAFSDDLYRYRWEGKIQEMGFNPYTYAPRATEITPYRDSLYPQIDGKDFPAVYGPLLELEQRAFYRFITAVTPDPARQLFWYKSVAALADLGIIAAILLLLRARREPVERVLIYAWCPLPVFEFWATGHNDAVVILLVMLGLVFAARNREIAAGFWLSLATAAKLWPALLIPAITGYRWRKLLAAGGILAAIALILSAPYWTNVTSNARFATGFLGGWRNNDSIHSLIAAFAGDPYTAKYITMGLIVAAALAIPALRWRVEARALALIVTILALSANVHPWYLTWIAPLLAMYPVPGLMLWVCLTPLAYGVLINWTILGVWNGLSPLRWLIYGPVAALLLFELRRIRR